MHFVNDLAREFHAAPGRIRPLERERIDHTRRSMGAVRLKTRRRIGKCIAVVNLKFVARAGTAVNRVGKIAVALRGEGMGSFLQSNSKLVCFWGPDAKMRFVFADNFRTYRITPLHSGIFSSEIRAMVVRDFASPPKATRFK